MDQQKAGQFIQANFFSNTGGLNLTDSPLAIKPDQAISGYNFDYVKTGGFKKTRTPLALNSSADAQLLSRAFDLYRTKSDVVQAMRLATTAWQALDTTTGTTTNLTEDTASAGSSFFSCSNQAVSVMVTTPATDVLWASGGGLSTLYGAYSASKVTKNGSTPATGAFTATVSTTGGTFTVGTYYYAVALRKSSTQAISNAGLDVSAVIANTTDKVTIDLTGLTGLDTTKYDKVYLYRSSVGGSTGFTAGALVAQINTTTTSYVDTGTVLTSSVVVPRSGSASLDNSELPSGTYEVIANFKRRMVTASKSTLYFSDINKPESWPLANSITIPSGGKITGLATIGYNHPGSGTTDEFLAVFKSNELWIIKGDDSTTWQLLFVDYIGCPNQSLIVNSNGLLYWVNNRGVYLWDGVGKPIYTSRPIEYLWGQNGSLTKQNLNAGCGAAMPSLNQIVWYLSDNIIGSQQFVLKLDTRLTLPNIDNFLGQRVLEGVFVQGKRTASVVACETITDPASIHNSSLLLTGDSSGYIYSDLASTTGTGNDVAFSYETADLDLGSPGVAKRFHKVVVWADTSGAFDINLDYWADYRRSESSKTTLSATLATSTGESTSLWDVVNWDSAYWDINTSSIQPLVFNLPNTNNNAEGDAIRLRFYNNDSGEPVTINGFSILYTTISLRK